MYGSYIVLSFTKGWYRLTYNRQFRFVNIFGLATFYAITSMNRHFLPISHLLRFGS